MRRVYPLVVSLPAKASGTAGAVAVRPLIPGALVTPAELILDSAKSDTQATFYVTPVARGRLPKARVQLHRQGSLLQEVTLPMKAVTQRLTWVLLALTILVPAFLLYTTKYNKMTGTVPRSMAPTPEDVRAEPATPPIAREPTIKNMPGRPGELLEYRLKEELPVIPHVDASAHLARWLGIGYDLACELATDHFSFYVGALLLGLTIISAVTHSSRRARRRGAPLTLAASAQT
jgi:hypothetical protein